MFDGVVAICSFTCDIFLCLLLLPRAADALACLKPAATEKPIYPSVPSRWALSVAFCNNHCASCARWLFSCVRLCVLSPGDMARLHSNVFPGDVVWIAPVSDDLPWEQGRVISQEGCEMLVEPLSLSSAAQTTSKSPGGQQAEDTVALLRLDETMILPADSRPHLQRGFVSNLHRLPFLNPLEIAQNLAVGHQTEEYPMVGEYFLGTTVLLPSPTISPLRVLKS